MQIGPDQYVQQHADSPGYGDKTIVDQSYLNSVAATEGRDIYGNGLNNGITNVRPIDYILSKAWQPIKRFISGEGSAGKGYYRIRYVGTPADRAKWSQ